MRVLTIDSGQRATRDDRRVTRLRVIAIAGLALAPLVRCSCPPTPLVPVPTGPARPPKVTISNLPNGSPGNVDKGAVDSTMGANVTVTATTCPVTVLILAGATGDDGVSEVDLVINQSSTLWNIAYQVGGTQVTPDGGGILLEYPQSLTINGASKTPCNNPSTPCSAGGTAINLTCPGPDYTITATGKSPGNPAATTTLTETLSCKCSP